MLQRILITGSIAYDLLLSYEGSFADAIAGGSVDTLSVSFFAPHLKRHHGGTGSNIAWNLRLLGGSPLLVGTVGKDGGEYCALLEERGIDTAHIERRDDSVTATAIIGTDDGQRQIAFFHPGADARGSWPDISDVCDDVSWGIVSARNPVVMMEAVRWFEKSKIPLLFDPGQLIIGLSPDELRSAASHCKGFLCNAYEWNLFSERTLLSKEHILKTAEFLIITYGEHGVELYRKEAKEGKEGKEPKEIKEVIVACRADRVINPTGAGDAFRAGVLFGLEKQWNLTDCCRLGAVMGSKVVEIEGTLLEDLDRNEVWEKAKQTYGEELPPVSRTKHTRI